MRRPQHVQQARQEGRPGVAAHDALVAAGHVAAPVQGPPPGQHGHLDGDRRQHTQGAVVARRQRLRQQRAEHRPERAADRDEAEQAFALRGREPLDRVHPDQGHAADAEGSDPRVEEGVPAAAPIGKTEGAQLAAAAGEQGGEDQEAHGEGVQRIRQEALRRQPAHERQVRLVEQRGQHEGEAEQPHQMVIAERVGDVLAQRPQQVVREQHPEERSRRPHRRAPFGRGGVVQAQQSEQEVAHAVDTERGGAR
jgi:hypothetical protein